MISAEAIIANEIKSYRENVFGKGVLAGPLPSEEAMAVGIVEGLREKGYEITLRGASAPNQPS